MSAHIANTPFRLSRSATQPTRRMFSSRSFREKPTSRESMVRTTSPSSTSTRLPASARRHATASATVDLPAEGRPVSHTVNACDRRIAAPSLPSCRSAIANDRSAYGDVCAGCHPTGSGAGGEGPIVTTSGSSLRRTRRNQAQPTTTGAGTEAPPRPVGAACSGPNRRAARTKSTNSSDSENWPGDEPPTLRQEDVWASRAPGTKGGVPLMVTLLVVWMFGFAAILSLCVVAKHAEQAASARRTGLRLIVCHSAQPGSRKRSATSGRGGLRALY